MILNVCKRSSALGWAGMEKLVWLERFERRDQAADYVELPTHCARCRLVCNSASESYKFFLPAQVEKLCKATEESVS
jgi:hypothetical protein